MRFIILMFILSSINVFAEDVGLLTSRLEAHNARINLIRNETKEIRLSTFIFDMDDMGKEMLGLLADAAKRGVKVKMNVDGMIRGLPKQFAMLKALEEAGVEIKLYHPFIRKIASINYRNHMKSLITSSGMILGDRNVTSAYFDRGGNHNYIGMDILVKGDESRIAKEHFDEVFTSTEMGAPRGIVTKGAMEKARLELLAWTQKAASTPIPALSDRAMVTATDLMYSADKVGGDNKKAAGIHKDIISMIRRSKTSLEFTNPYVLFTPELKKELSDAIARGVKIRINSNSAASTDSPLMAIAWDTKKQELLEMGIEVNELKPGQFLHAKTIVRDGEEVFVGSFNLDPRSQNLNLENGIFIRSKTLATRLTNHNRRIVGTFMTRVLPDDIKSLNASEKAGHCLKKSIRKLVTDTFLPLL